VREGGEREIFVKMNGGGEMLYSSSVLVRFSFSVYGRSVHTNGDSVQSVIIFDRHNFSGLNTLTLNKN